tara:strand:+ start:1702 stop:3114 length:1413 start_codon:yes stop_codon:yes gene_type:complete
MKKYFLIPILTGLLFTVSCSEQLDRLPADSLVAASAFQTVGDLENGLVGALGVLNPDNIVAFGAIFTDNCRVGIDNGGQQLGLLNQQLNSATGDGGLWTNRYFVINQLNRVIVAAESITPLAGERSRYNDVLGRALALRAFYHLELLSFYGFNMLDGGSLGVIYQNFLVTNQTGERNTTAEVFAFIEADLAAAGALITSTDINYPTDDFITFTRARAALFSGNYASAASLAGSLISKYPLANATQYASMFGGDVDATEVIFKYDNVQGSNNSVAGNFIFTGTGGDFIEASSELFNAYDATDIRRDIIMIPSVSPGNTGDALTIAKYPANGDENYINDFKIMRVSEMYLVRAEAYARSTSPNFGGAAADIQSIRTIRGSSVATATYTSVAEAILDISNERRLELAFEGHRYLDIKRYRGILNVGITRDATDVGYLNNNFPSTVGAADARFTFPLPDAEVNANPEITQATGY